MLWLHQPSDSKLITNQLQILTRNQAGWSCHLAQQTVMSFVYGQDYFDKHLIVNFYST